MPKILKLPVLSVSSNQQYSIFLVACLQPDIPCCQVWLSGKALLMPLACGSRYQLSDCLTHPMHVWLSMTHTNTQEYTIHTQLHPHTGKLFANFRILQDTHTQIEGIPMCGWLSVCEQQTQTEECKQRLLVQIPAEWERTRCGSVAFTLRARRPIRDAALFTVHALFTPGCFLGIHPAAHVSLGEIRRLQRGSWEIKSGWRTSKANNHDTKKGSLFS